MGFGSWDLQIVQMRITNGNGNTRTRITRIGRMIPRSETDTVRPRNYETLLFDQI
jgi:hypothetical protein